MEFVSRLIRAGQLAGVSCALATGLSAVSRTFPDQIEFNRDVRPILANSCFKCHGPDAANNRSELRLDLSEFATAPRQTKDGETITAIVPGSIEESELWARIMSPEPNVVMPPPDALHQLEDSDRQVLKRWIEQGAAYESHWAYIAPAAVTPPSVPSEHARNPIDHFVQQPLAALGFGPSLPADSVTLARRLALDLTGLPPDPADVAALAADPSDENYAAFVEQLLQSPHYGERMAVPWLDLVRFADTVGFHGDQRQNIFPYRDYVIGAFNRNLPYDQFIREQLAGDLLPNPTVDQRVATGFNRLNLMTREGGAQPQEYLAKSAADRVRAVSTAFMGSTVGCAECHDHKYDPFTANDFYSLAAYFADVKQWGVYSDYQYTPNPDLKGFNNDFPFPPEIDVPSSYLAERRARLQRRYQDREATVVAAILAAAPQRESVVTWASVHREILGGEASAWTVIPLLGVEPAANTAIEPLPDSSVRFSRFDPDVNRGRQGSVLTLNAPAGDLAAVRVEVLPDESAGGRVSEQDLGVFNFRLQLSLQRAGVGEPVALEVGGAYPDRDTWSYDNAYLQTSVHALWRSRPQDAEEAQETIWQLAEPVQLAAGDRLIATVLSNDVSRVRFSVSPVGLRRPGESLAPAMATAAQRLETPATLSDDEWVALIEAYLGSGRQADYYAESLVDLREIVATREGYAFTMVAEAAEPLVTRVLPRGDWQDDSGAVVQPHPPAFMVSEAADPDRRATRLDLADWIASAENPLTARTFVNRLWQQFFGTGLSAAVDDLGIQGEYPSHPDLLDWLATEFVASGWDVKAMIRLIVDSSTYRQSSQRRLDLEEVDPDNRMLAYFPPRRLEAEFVRDQALHAAGLLNRDIGGPSAHPYQPSEYYESLNFPLRRYQADAGELQYRRGLYTHWQRTFLHPMMANFDAPSREECTAERTVSNTPQQALTLLNDPTFVEAARALATRTLRETGDQTFDRQLDAAFKQVLSRAPQPAEVTALQTLHEAQLETYAAAPDAAVALASIGQLPVDASVDPVALAAWTQVARVLLNLNEAIVRY